MKGKNAFRPLLGALALCCLLVAGTLPMAGCNGSQVARDIVNWTPTLESAVTTVDTTAAILLPADAPVFAMATAGFDAGAALLVAQAKAYLANPSASILAQLQQAVVALQQSVSTAVLEALKITDPASQQHALAAIQGVGTIVTVILALVQQLSGNVALAQMSATSTVKLAEVRPYLVNERAVETVAAHYRISHAEAAARVSDADLRLERSGF